MTVNAPSETNPRIASDLAGDSLNDEEMTGLINPGEILSIAWDGVALRSML
ncbi:MAG: hypothetical protein AAGD96_07455 [Chloroflexota bacterium]